MRGRVLAAGLRVVAVAIVATLGGSAQGSVVARDSFRFCAASQFQAIVFEMFPSAIVGDFRTMDILAGGSLASMGPCAFPAASSPAEADTRRPIPRRLVVANPEPGSVLIWTSLGLTWAGKKWWRRKKPKASPASQHARTKGRNSRVKQPWPDHVRFAILDLIDQGRSNRTGKA